MRSFLFALLFAAPAMAQDRVISAITDVWGGKQQTVLLEINADDQAALDLVVTSRESHGWTDAPTVTRVENAFFLGPANRPELMRRETGALTIIDLGCFACGRHHNGIEVVIDYRDDEWMLIGYWDSGVDRIAPWRSTVCDVNLVTGAVDITLAENPVERLETSERAFPVAELNMDYTPDICKKIWLSEEEWEPYKPADWEE